MLQDVRYALRTLRRQPLTAIVAVFALALGIGGTTTVFSAVQAVILRPLPFPEAGRLVRVWELTREGKRFSFSEPNYLDLRARSRVLQSVAAYREISASAALADGSDPERIMAAQVSASLPAVLGVRPSIGRMFTEADDRPGSAERQVVLADGLWRRRFGADPGVVGRGISVDGQAYVVAAVLPAGFDFPEGAEAWIPLGANPLSERDNKDLAVVGRLAPGATSSQLGGDLREIARQLSDEYPVSNAGWGAAAASFRDWLVAPRFRDAVWVLFGAVSLLLLLACANVANLLVARAAARRMEMHVRIALGASRGRLVRQLLTESALLAALGTGIGVLLAFWSVDVVRALGSGRVPRIDGLQIDGVVLAFTCLAGAASCFVFGLAPALYTARLNPGSSLDEGVRYTAGGRRLRELLVVLEVALALVLLVSAGLMGNSLVRLMRVDAGFDAEHSIAMPIDLPPGRYVEGRAAAFYDELLTRVRTVPGVTAAGATSTNPFRQFGFSNSVTPEERAAEAPPSGLVQAGWRSVTPGYFETLRIPVLSGRTFTAADREGAERVVVVSASLARQLWPGQPVLGRRIFWGGTTGRPRTVVGVTGDIRDVRLDVEPTPMLFLPHPQVDLPSMTVVLRTETGAAAVVPVLRDILRGMDPALPAPSVYEIAASRSEGASGYRFNLWLLGAFAAIGLVLAVTGVYAMLAHTVSERRREIAVRLALGASGSRIVRLVLQSGLWLSLAGIVLGAAAAAAATRVLSRLLYGVAPTDPLTFAAAALALLAAAALACYLPARQAARVDPVSILRD